MLAASKAPRFEHGGNLAKNPTGFPKTVDHGMTNIHLTQFVHSCFAFLPTTYVKPSDEKNFSEYLQGIDSP
jgi:hypothetical protein